ncbi:SRPBCC domain-containing protein [Myxococcus eversor]|uniref:SRPBCC domain-containing protein n=1 Tax=Myxococcus eversor TaxID=2709661 RepID=UPI0013D67594|nr:SRPBCC domain-containing protein [Myxococcus eversor]
MKTPPVVHGSFTIERTYKASPARVYAAWSDLETKAQWFLGPPDRWTLVKRELDFRVGGQEQLHGQFGGKHSTVFTARYHDILPNERMVYAYDMHVGDKHLSVSLATVELHATKEGGTRMVFTEQAAFLDGEDGTRSREEGTAVHFDRLALVLEASHDIVSSRAFDAPRARVYEAFSDPEQLTLWWGPQGSTNTFEQFELRPGGKWRFTMQSAEGARYAMDKEFIEVVPERSVVIQHHQRTHHFVMRLDFADEGEGTRLTWRMRFESKDEVEKVRGFVEAANEQNFDRLAAHLGSRLRAALP